MVIIGLILGFCFGYLAGYLRFSGVKEEVKIASNPTFRKTKAYGGETKPIQGVRGTLMGVGRTGAR